MTDNRELDARVAVARGWTVVELDYHYNPVDFTGRTPKDEAGKCSIKIIPYFSTDIAAAWVLVEEMANAPLQGFILKLDWHCPEVAGSGYAWASWSGFDPECGAYGYTPQEAICKAYLKWKAGNDDANN